MDTGPPETALPNRAVRGSPAAVVSRKSLRYSPLFVVLATTGVAAMAEVRPVVELEEVVTTCAPANNGAGPLWCYGAPLVARVKDDVYLSVIETGKDVPPLCNTRWQLWHRSAASWKLAQGEKEYRQREPCPIAIFRKGSVFLSVNPSTEPPGTRYGRCRPVVLEFDPRRLSDMPRTHTPVWAEEANFTDHSYRGFAADGEIGELLLLNVHSRTGAQFVSFRDSGGTWHQNGKIEFPIRACYPQVALRKRAAHVLAIGDIVEPVEEWRKLKFEKLKREWDYVFRRLFYTFTPDIATTDFVPPIEIDTVEKTAGHITNLDLHVDDAGAAHLLYLRRPHHYEFIRDKYFPGQPMTAHLEYVVLKDGKRALRRSLAQTPLDMEGLEPSYGRFHASSSGQLYVIAAGNVTGGQAKPAFGNYIGRIVPDAAKPTFIPVALKHPFRCFFTNTPRGGSARCDIIDLFGVADDSPNLRYARIRLIWE